MATAYSEEVSPGGSGYNRIRLRVEYSGTSATCYIEFRRTSTWSDTWGDDAASITFNGQTVNAPYWYTGSVDGTWRTIDSASGFTVSLSGGTYSWHFNNPLTGSVLDCGGTITIPSQQVAPDTPTVSVATNTSDYTALNVSWGTASYGTPSTGTSYVYRGTSASPTQLQYTKTTTGTSLWTNTGCTPNTRYYYRARAKNDADLWSSYSADSDAVTLARPANVSISNTTDTSITVSYSTYADGGEYDKDIQYSIDGGTTWVTGDTVTGGSVATGTFTISGLTAHTSYTIRTRVSTTAGTSNGTTLSAIATHVRLYGSVNSETKWAKKLYGSLELLQSFTATGQCTAGSVSGSFYPVTFVPKLLATDSNLLVKGLVDFSTCKIKMARQAITGNTSVSYYDSTTTPVTEIPIVSGTPSQVETYGIHLGGAGTIEYTVTDDVYAPVTKKIKKLYGSVNGLTKLIFEG